MTHTKYPPVVIVDENDNEIGSAMLSEVWQKGLYHRVVAVFVEDSKNRILLQLRGSNVGIYPNCWDQAAGGHVDEKNSYKQAAIDELKEELGISNAMLKLLGTFRSNNKLGDGRIINQFERVYLVKVPYDIDIKIEKKEIDKVEWFTVEELITLATNIPNQLTPGLLYCLRKYYPKIGI